jgi:peptide/nickel transport system ATP-binding protein
MFAADPLAGVDRRTPLLSVRDLSVTFPQRGEPAVHAVRGIS